MAVRNNQFSVEVVPRKEMRKETAIKAIKALINADNGRSDNAKPEDATKDEETRI